MENNKFIKFFMTLMFSTAFLFCFSQFSSSVYDSVFNQDHVFSQGTKIGLIDISGLSESEAKNKLINAVMQWEDQCIILIQLSELEKPLDNRIFQFDIQKSLDQAQNGQANKMDVSLKEDGFKDFFQSIDSPAVSEINKELLEKDLLNFASMLNSKKIIIDLFSYTSPNQEKEIALSQSNSQNIKNQPDLIKLVAEVNEVTIPPQQKFSLLSFLQKHHYVLTQNSLNIISSLFYQTILPTNFDILERHIGFYLPANIEMGYEAKVVPNHFDLTFINPNNIQYKIKLINDDGKLNLSLVGHPFYYRYKINSTEPESYKPRTIVQYSALLNAEQEKTVQEGKDGFDIKMYRETYKNDGQIVSSVLISEDFYAPQYRIVLKKIQDNRDSNQLKEVENTAKGETTEQVNGTKQVDQNLFESLDEVEK